MEDTRLQTVIETTEYIKQALSCMDEASQNSFIHYIARNPTAGALIPGTGGARKIRWASSEFKGKRGGSRVIYYYHNQNMPIFLFTVYGKNQKENLTKEECSLLRKIIKQIVNEYEE